MAGLARVGAWLGLTPPQLRSTVGLGVQLFLVLSGLRMALVARDTLLLDRVPTAWFPGIYGGTSVFMLVALTALGPLLRRRSPRRAGGILLVASAALMVALGVVTGRRLPLPDLAIQGTAYVLVGLVEDICLILFWSAAARHVDTRASRRVFPLLSAFGTIAVIAASSLQLTLTRLLPVHDLYFVAGAFFLAAGGVASSLRPPGRGDRGAPVARAAPEAGAPLVLDGYVIALAVIAFAGVSLKTLVDLVFKMQVASASTEAASMAAYFAGFQAVTSSTLLLVQLFLTGYVLRRLGIARALFVTPTALGAAVALGALEPTKLVGSIVRATDKVIATSFQLPVSQALLGPVEDAQQISVRAFVQAKVPQLGIVFGAAICAGYAALGLDRPELVFVIGLVLVAVWWAAAAWMQGGYRRKVVTRLQQGRVDPLGSGDVFVDDDFRDAARRALLAPDADAVQGVLRLMREGAIEFPAADLATALEAQAAPQLRVELLDLLPADADPSPSLVELLGASDARVRAAAVRYFGRSGPLERIRPALEDAAAPVRLEAAVALARGTEADRRAARERLERWLGSDRSEDRVAAARIAATLGEAEVAGRLSRLLDDPSPEVRRAAAEALAGVGPEILAQAPVTSALWTALGDPDATSAVSRALTDPSAIVPVCARVLDDAEALPRRARGCDILGQIGSEAAREALSEVVVQAPDAVRRHAVAGLIRAGGGSRLSSAQRDRLEGVLYATKARAERNRDVAELLVGRDSRFDQALRQALLDAENLRKALILDLLVLLFPDRGLEVASSVLGGYPEAGREHALDLLDESLPRHVAREVLAVYEEPASITGRALDAEAEIPRAGLEDPDPWVRSTAAAWAHATLEPTRLAPLASTLAAMAESPFDFERECAVHGADGVITVAGDSISNRVLYLKSVELFASLAGEDLAVVARAADLVEFAPGQVILREGDPPEEVYILIGGRVLISSRGRTFARRGEGELIGEMGVIERMPRSTTVIAEGAVTSLRLEASAFRQLMLMIPTLTDSIIRTLSSRLREAAPRTAAVAGLEAPEPTPDRPPTKTSAAPGPSNRPNPSDEPPTLG